MTVIIQKATANTPAPGVPFFTPEQSPPSGTALPKDGVQIPTVFTPLQLRSLTLPNRFVVSPMCMYSADDGHLTDFHLVHIGQFALHGAGLTIVEATSVTPNGRITPEDSGIWSDSHIAPLKRIVDLVHSQGHKIGIQLGHAGRKASVLAPWFAKERGHSQIATPEQGGWEDNVWGASAIPFSPASPHPKEMTVEQIESFIQSFADAAVRAVKAGFDTIEIHGAHGYLLSSFLSPISNQRTDTYGGSFANRTRLLLSVIRAVRAVIPAAMPLLLRVSATEWMEHTGQPSWDVAQTLELARLLPDLGVDMLDVSSGGNNADQQIPSPITAPTYQIDIAGRIRDALRKDGKQQLLIGAVGMITSAELAKSIVQEDGTVEATPEKGHELVEVDGENGQKALADLVLMGRQFLREPEFVLRTAHQLGVEVQWPLQYQRGNWHRGQKI
ncbi:hypothetical protein B0T17DRAFT_495877 [Bombardia bombarda]|uniref:NADH:flavin oxidoreductase/NADH oxidase N-terminal domain-containing protein n=1 Tax=Bombardia bombarda TaxID=252184 RepID=A0AA40BY86_9PEZI|nr:hypothetical protein B0T17DRAFT_495877 [Bombardia bombarda]